MAHFSLVVILFGALLKAAFGFVELLEVPEGGSRALQNRPGWEVAVDKFAVDYYAGGLVPKSFSTALRILRGGRPAGAKTIRVNDPLEVEGLRFYQASWGATGDFRGVTLKLGERGIFVKRGVPKRLPGTTFKVQADAMVPDFMIGEDGRVGTASLEPVNPAARLRFKAGRRAYRPFWLVRNEPGLCFVEDSEGRLSHAPSPPVELAAVDAVLFSGIQAAYDPGYRFVVGGSVLWILGLALLFYPHRRRLWAIVEPAEGGSLVSAGGWSSRGAREFDAEFEALMRALRDELAGRSDFKLSKNPFVEVS